MAKPLNSARIQDLERSSHPTAAKIARAIRRHQESGGDSGSGLIARIEAERESLMSDDSPLCDGTLPDVFPGERSLTVRDVCKASRPPRWAKLLYSLVREVRPAKALELGTNVGISAAYQAAALLENGPDGRLITLEGSLYRQRLARRLFDRLALHNTSFVQGVFDDTLRPTLAEHGPVDFAFIDGNHQYEPTLAYLDIIWNHANDGAVFVFDDIRWSQDMVRAWNAIKLDSRVSVVVDLQSMGLCVMSKHPTGERSSFGPLHFY